MHAFLKFIQKGLQGTKSLPETFERKLEVLVLLNMWKLLTASKAFCYGERTITTANMLSRLHPERSATYTSAWALWICGVRPVV